LDILGVAILMLVWFTSSLLHIHKLSYFYLDHLVSLFLFAFFSSFIVCSICGYLFSHSRELLFLGGVYHLNSWDDFKIVWWDKRSVQWMILVYHKFVVDVHNLQDLKRKSGCRSSDNSLFFGFYCLSS
jgi:hypothetical protein